jgi:Lrp/AsnC family transcriptional regulator, leucine-responsive regulatory protein
MIDAIDREILKILQSDARTSNADIARSVGLAASATHERIRKLHESGVIRGFHASIDPKALDLGLLAFAMVRTDGTEDCRATAASLGGIAEVLEVHNVAGEDCYIVKIRASDPEDLGRLLRERIRRIPAVTGTRTTIVLETTKDGTALPFDRAAASED